MDKYEKLIEYITNEADENKINALFHEIVVERSRNIYESIMEMEMDEMAGGDPVDEMIDDISSDEVGMNEDDFGAEDDGMGGLDDMEMGSGDEMGSDDAGEMGEENLEDRVVDLEDQLENLMAEFDEIMNDGEGDMEMGSGEEMEYEDGEGDMEMGSGEEMEYEDGEGDMEMEGMFNENVSLTKVTKGISNSTEEGTVNKKSVNAVNSGKKGMQGKPHQQVGEESGSQTPTVKPGTSTTVPKQARVSEPKKKGEDAAVNKKSTNGS